MVFQSSKHGLYVTFLAGILNICFGQNQCPQMLYVEDIETEEGLFGVFRFDGRECKVRITDRDGPHSKDVNVVLLTIAAVGYLLWLFTICIAFFICCYKRKDTHVEKELDVGLRLANGQPHCAPPSGPAPRPEDNAVKLEEDHYARAPQPKEKQHHHQPAIKSNDPLLASKEDSFETSSRANSVQSQSIPDYLEPKQLTDQTTTTLTTANPTKSGSTSLSEDSNHESGRDRIPSATGSRRTSLDIVGPKVVTSNPISFRDQLRQALAKKGTGATSDDDGNLSTGNDEKNKTQRVLSEEVQYDAVDIVF